ncbi:hypothetical protein RCOM_1029830 [Ricinus communis]|uniref:Disease resistance N-terminal domain-containing protein n=1 Tax=Ricinus communis TaxID=3988 RepID=B9SK98_RICCO|nr:hypothetical protein RCOM_1029830 [Ricinus communis]
MAAVPTDFLAANIASLIENEATLLGRARDEIEEIQRELLIMRSFLEDTDRKRSQTEGEKTWVARVGDLVYDVEDIIDEFVYLTNKRHCRKRFTKILYRAIGFPQYLWERHQVVQAAKDQKSEASSCSENYRAVIHVESPLFLSDDELVGMEDERELLVGWLTNGEQQRETISVVGMGGLWKNNSSC